MTDISWELKLARRLAWITIVGGAASWGIRQFRLGFVLDPLNIYLAVFYISLFFLLKLRAGHRPIVALLIFTMVLVGVWSSFNVVEPRPGTFLVVLTAITLASAYYGFRLSLLLTLLSSSCFMLLGYLATRTNPEAVSSLTGGMTTLFSAWFGITVGFATVSTIISALVSYAVGQLQKSLSETQNLLNKTQEHKKNLEEKERLLKLFTELSSDYVYQINLQNANLVPEVFAGSFERITGYALDKLALKGGWMAIVHPEDRENLARHMPSLLDGKSTVTEYRIISASGKTVWLRDHIRPVRDEVTGAVTILLGAVHNVTERRMAEEQVANLAFYDPLTSLPNRRLLIDRLEQTLALSARTGLRGALLFIDLDHFKDLNETKGHDTGDQLLIQQARRLRKCIREGDTVARLGGDEFIIILGELAADATAAAAESTEISQRILRALSLPVALSHRTLTDYENTCSIGATVFLGHEYTVEELLRHVDMAMYQAKADGRNTFRFFDPDMHKLLAERLALEIDLKQALMQRQFQLYLQPQLDGERLIGAEVLLRWRHPTKGMIAPLEFIPAAERTGLIVEIGNWVMHEACNILREWSKNDRTTGLSLAVNVSARQFRQADFTGNISRILQMAGIKGNQLKLELTESLALDNISDTIMRMQTLRELGIGISLDDFGTGQSSLSYLKSLPLTQIKIDQSFVRDIASDPNGAILVQTIIGMAQNLKLDVIAEGVETLAQKDFLLTHGCSSLQGYLFGKPVHWSQFEATFLAKAS